jgi:hypothetical protein
MELDTFAIEEFQELYFKEYGIKLNQQEALEYGTRLINLVKAVFGRNLPERKNVDIDNKK